MFVFTTTAKRKSPLQKQDAADSSARQSPAAPAPSTLRACCCVHQESIESHMEMKSINGSFITLLNGSDMRSLLNKPHQPGQVLLPLDKAQAAYKADVFPCNPAYRLWMGMSMGKPHCCGKASSQGLHGNSQGTQWSHPMSLLGWPTRLSTWDPADAAQVGQCQPQRTFPAP